MQYFTPATCQRIFQRPLFRRGIRKRERKCMSIIETISILLHAARPTELMNIFGVKKRFSVIPSLPCPSTPPAGSLPHPVSAVSPVRPARPDVGRRSCAVFVHAVPEAAQRGCRNHGKRSDHGVSESSAAGPPERGGATTAHCAAPDQPPCQPCGRSRRAFTPSQTPSQPSSHRDCLCAFP